MVETFSGLSVKGEIPGSRRADVVINDPASGSQYIRITDVNEIKPSRTKPTTVALAGGVDPGHPGFLRVDGGSVRTVADRGADDGQHRRLPQRCLQDQHLEASVCPTSRPPCRRPAWPDRQDVFVVNDSAPPRMPNQPRRLQDHDPDDLAVNTGDSYSASYGPWILIPHPQRLGDVIAIPPGGGVMGVTARIDATVGVFRAPAGVIASISNAVGVQAKFTDTELGDLNSSNINVIRSVVGAGICVMGARTRKTYGADRYISARRTLIYIKEVLRRTTQFAVFENNDQRLWSSLTHGGGSHPASAVGGRWTQGSQRHRGLLHPL